MALQGAIFEAADIGQLLADIVVVHQSRCPFDAVQRTEARAPCVANRTNHLRLPWNHSSEPLDELEVDAPSEPPRDSHAIRRSLLGVSDEEMALLGRGS